MSDQARKEFISSRQAKIRQNDNRIPALEDELNQIKKRIMLKYKTFTYQTKCEIISNPEYFFLNNIVFL